MAGGWNRRTPAGAVRCDCAPRRLSWARLDWRMAGNGCCWKPCCIPGTDPVIVMATRDQIHRLRHRAVTEGWKCPRCGEYVARHDRNYECLDALTQAMRELKVRRRR